MAPQIPGAPRLTLDERTADRVWNWTLARQGLAPSARLTAAQEVAEAALGLHAARLPSPFTIVASRTSDPAAPAALFTTQVRSSLLTLRCMRKTLHMLPLPLASAAHAATLPFRERDALRAVHNAGIGPGTVTEITARLCDLLAGNPLTYRTILQRLTQAPDGLHAVRVAVKLAWERGILAYLNTSGSWNRETRTFALTRSAYPALDLTLSRAQAIGILITAYFDRYGPATLQDATWWSGLPAAGIRTALLASGREVISVATPWSPQPCLMFADQISEALAGRPATGAHLLAREDTALKAYHDTRSRYLGKLPQSQAFNQIGEALPAILINGQTAGTWSWDTRTRSIRTHLIPGITLTPQLRNQVRTRAATLTRTLRSACQP